MILRLTLLWLLAATAGWSQPEFTLRSGEELSLQNQYGRSTEQLEAFIEANPARLYDHSQALLLMSYNHMQLGDYAAALAANAASLELKARLRADDLVNNYVRSGVIHLLRGNFHQAISHLTEAKRFPIEDILLFAAIDGQLATAYRGLQQWELAQTHYRQAIESLLIEYPEDHPDVIMNYYHLGNLYLDWNRPEDARNYFRQGLERNGLASGQRFLNILLNNALGKTYADQPEQAEGFHRQALDLANQVFGKYHRETARSALLLADMLYRQGRRDEARDYIGLAIAALNPELNSLSWEEIPGESGLIIDQALLAEALGLKARWLLDSALPRDQRLQPALLHAERAAALLETAMDDRIDQADRLELLPIARRALAPGIRAGLQRRQEENAQDGQERAFQLLMTLRRLQFRAYTAGALKLEGDYAQTERRLHRDLRLAEMNFRLQARDLTAGRKLRAVQDQYNRHREEWASREPATYQLRYGPPPATPAQIRQQLGPRDALLAYLIDEQSGWLFGIGQTDVQVFEIESAGNGPAESLRAELERATEVFRRAIAESDAEGIADGGYRLYEQLLAPAGNWLRGKEALHILPDGVLHSLPFEALLVKPVGKKRIRFHRLPFLIHDFSVQYRHLGDRTQTGGDPVAPNYGLLDLAPFSGEAPPLVVSPSQRLLFDSHLHPSSVLAERGYFNPLPAATEETDQLRSMLGQSGQSGSFQLGRQATISVLRQELDRARFIHLSSYGFVKGCSPEEAGLVLQQHPDPDLQGGVLPAWELQRFNVRATELLTIDVLEMEVLGSSREAGSIPLTGSLMLSGLPYLLYGDRVDAPRATFFPELYRALMDGHSVVEAVHRAKRSMARTESLAAPAHWATYRLLER